MFDKIISGVLITLDVLIFVIAFANVCLFAYLMIPGGESPGFWSHMFGWLFLAYIFVRVVSFCSGHSKGKLGELD